MVRTWIKKEAQTSHPHEIPWAPLSKPLRESTVALVSSAGLALVTDQPFNQAGERRNPWWGDPSFRILPRRATERDVRLYHLHVDPGLAERDLNTFFPLQRLLELEGSEEIGRSASHHYSFMGYNLEPQALLEVSVPTMIQHMMDDGVDAALLIPV
jgi:D-proline reductase (dithiol) PrdB